MITPITGDAVLNVASATKPDAGPTRPAAKPSSQGSAEGPSDVPNYGFGLRVDEATREVIAVVVDRETGKVIREIPSEDMRTASKVIRNLIGPLIDRIA